METRFGQDFSGVRVHADSKAARSAEAVNSLAYTVGNHIVFSDGQYAPETPFGRVLLAHELAHVLQQRDQPSTASLRMGSASDPLEQEAHQISLKTAMDPAGQAGSIAISRAQPGTVQGGWPLIVSDVALLAGSIYAYWANRCLKPLEAPMYTVTFGNAARTGGFRLWYYNQTHAPVPNKVWDAFGHCWIACAGTEKCGRFTTAVAGKTREFFREYFDSNPHDSYEQDTNNQTLGRSFGAQNQDCEGACRNAALPGGAMDLSAPPATLWDPVNGDYYASLAPSSPGSQTALADAGPSGDQTVPAEGAPPFQSREPPVPDVVT